MTRAHRFPRAVPLAPLLSAASVTALVVAGAVLTGPAAAAGTAAGAPATRGDAVRAGAVRTGTVRAAAVGTTRATSSTTASYLCFVTYPGGSTNVHYGLTFAATAPDTVTPLTPFTVTVSPPAITPNPAINVSVKQVRLSLLIPPGTRVLAVRQSGGSGLGPAGARVELDDGVAVLAADGPFPAGTPFTLPTVTFTLLAPLSGTVAVAHGGATLSSPSFSWVRTDPSDGVTQRPFACFTDQPVALTGTAVTP